MLFLAKSLYSIRPLFSWITLVFVFDSSDHSFPLSTFSFHISPISRLFGPSC